MTSETRKVIKWIASEPKTVEKLKQAMASLLETVPGDHDAAEAAADLWECIRSKWRASREVTPYTRGMSRRNGKLGGRPPSLHLHISRDFKATWYLADTIRKDVSVVDVDRGEVEHQGVRYHLAGEGVGVFETPGWYRFDRTPKKRDLCRRRTRLNRVDFIMAEMRGLGLFQEADEMQFLARTQHGNVAGNYAKRVLAKQGLEVTKDCRLVVRGGGEELAAARGRCHAAGVRFADEVASGPPEPPREGPGAGGCRSPGVSFPGDPGHPQTVAVDPPARIPYDPPPGLDMTPQEHAEVFRRVQDDLGLIYYLQDLYNPRLPDPGPWPPEWEARIRREIASIREMAEAVEDI